MRIQVHLGIHQDRCEGLNRVTGRTAGEQPSDVLSLVWSGKTGHDFLTHLAERPLPVEAINPSRLISRSAILTVSREIPGQSASTS